MIRQYAALPERRSSWHVIRIFSLATQSEVGLTLQKLNFQHSPWVRFQNSPWVRFKNSPWVRFQDQPWRFGRTTPQPIASLQPFLTVHHPTNMTAPTATTTAGDGKQVIGLFPCWSDMGRVHRQLWSSDFDLGWAWSVQKTVAPGLKVRSELNYEKFSSFNSIKWNSPKDGGVFTVGANVGDLRHGSRPSGFLKWNLNTQPDGVIMARLHHGGNGLDHCYGSVDVKNRFQNAAITVGIGHNPGPRFQMFRRVLIRCHSEPLLPRVPDRL